MTYKEAVEILNKYYTGRKDKPDFPDFDDMHEALYLVNELLNEHLYFEKTFEQHIAENFADSEFVRSIRQQVCDEIRTRANCITQMAIDGKIDDCAVYIVDYTLLNQIGKGSAKNDN